MSNALDKQKKLAKDFIEREETWDGESILKLRTDDCTYEILPRDLGYPKMNKEQTLGFYNQLQPVWSDYKVTVYQTIHDPEERTCAIHILNEAGSPVGPFNVETVWLLTFTEDSSKICKVVEIIIDSKVLGEWGEKLQKLQTEQEKS